MSEDDIGNLKVAEHGGGDFARVSTGHFVADVLRTDFDRRVADEGGNGRNRRERRAHQDIDVVLIRDGIDDRLCEFNGFRSRFIHFPVTCNENFA